MAGKTKIAVLGGGLGSMSALAWITSAKDAAERFDITVYQMGWRLGGKGASGRAGPGKRIEEHGLHIWFGFYENAFRTMRMALEELAKQDPPIVATYRDVDQAFQPHSLVSFAERWNGEWVAPWTILFPPNGGTPGIGEPIADPVTIIETLLGWLVERWDEFAARRGALLAGYAEALELPEHHAPHLEGIAGATGLHRALELWKKHRSGPRSPLIEGVIGDLVALLLRAYLEALWVLLRGSLDDPEVRHFFVLNDLGGRMLIGTLEERLLARGFEAADGEDWVEWMKRYGAKPPTLTSALVETVYDLVFGFVEGDTTRPSFAAGTAVRGILRMIFTYKGALMFKMNAGMGDTIFTPFYGLLKSRGVRFEFFHKVDAIRLAKDRDVIEAIELTRQVNLRDPNAEYWPLENVKGLDCWPSEPLWDQIQDAEKLKHDPYNGGQPYNLESWWTSWPGVGRVTLERGRDFDLVLLGIPIGAIPYVAPELVDRIPEWRKAIRGDGSARPMQTTPTLGVQLWLTETAEQLGWTVPEWVREAAAKFERKYGKPVGLSCLLGGYAQPLDTIADMSHLFPAETWPPENEPKSVQYICGPYHAEEPPPPFSDHEYPRRELERLKAISREWLDRNAARVWPKGASPTHPNGLDPSKLFDPSGAQGPARWNAQYYRVNVDPNERYVLSVPGSTESRVQCSNTGVENLLIAGDWTWNPVLNAGCVEATVASGMEASRVLTGQPEIAGDWRPRPSE